MAGLAIGTFVTFNDRIRLQNFFPNEKRIWKKEEYGFAGFGYGGTTTELAAGNVSSQLVMGMNKMSLSIAEEAVAKRWIVEVQTVWLNPNTLEEKKAYTTDIFTATQFEHDNLRISIELSSPLDAVTAEAPRRRLTEKLVGALPSTGGIALL